MKVFKYLRLEKPSVEDYSAVDDGRYLSPIQEEYSLNVGELFHAWSDGNASKEIDAELMELGKYLPDLEKRTRDSFNATYRYFTHMAYEEKQSMKYSYYTHDYPVYNDEYKSERKCDRYIFPVWLTRSASEKKSVLKFTVAEDDPCKRIIKKAKEDGFILVAESSRVYLSQPNVWDDERKIVVTDYVYEKDESEFYDSLPKFDKSLVIPQPYAFD